MFSAILGVYILLLVVGGAIGFKKAGSKVSLITASLFAVLLAIAGFSGIPRGAEAVIALQVVLVFVFGIRFAKKKKFMPAGMMALVTVLAIILELLSRSV